VTAAAALDSRELIDCARGGQGLVGARAAAETSGTVPSADDGARTSGSGRRRPSPAPTTPPRSDLLMLQGVFARR